MYYIQRKIVENPSQTWKSIISNGQKLEPILSIAKESSKNPKCETLETNLSKSTPLLYIKHLGSNKIHSSSAKICIFCDVVTVKEKKNQPEFSLSDPSLRGPRAISVLLLVNILVRCNGRMNSVSRWKQDTVVRVIIMIAEASGLEFFFT